MAAEDDGSPLPWDLWLLLSRLSRKLEAPPPLGGEVDEVVAVVDPDRYCCGTTGAGMLCCGDPRCSAACTLVVDGLD